MGSGNAGGTRKHSRNVTKCQRYRASGRREKNKGRKATRHEKHMADAARRTQYMTPEKKAKRHKASEARKRRGKVATLNGATA